MPGKYLSISFEHDCPVLLCVAFGTGEGNGRPTSAASLHHRAPPLTTPMERGRRNHLGTGVQRMRMMMKKMMTTMEAAGNQPKPPNLTAATSSGYGATSTSHLPCMLQMVLCAWQWKPPASACATPRRTSRTSTWHRSTSGWSGISTMLPRRHGRMLFLTL